MPDLITNVAYGDWGQRENADRTGEDNLFLWVELGKQRWGTQPITCSQCNTSWMENTKKSQSTIECPFCYAVIKEVKS
jgi:hypothetical protein